MLLVAAAQAATLSLRIGTSGLVDGERQIGGSGFVAGYPFPGAEVGLDLRLTDHLRVGASGQASIFRHFSVGALAEWSASGWTRTGFVLGGRLSYSAESAGCAQADGCPEVVDWPVLEAPGVMLQVRPGVRFAFGPRGFGLTVAADTDRR